MTVPPGDAEARAGVAARMEAAATELLDALAADQRASAMWPFAAAERRNWFYTPTDHGGVPLSAMTPTQQQLTHRLVATGLSPAGYVTVAAIIGLENILDHTEDWTAGFGRERGRDPGLYWIAVFGTPGDRAWGWRFGGHHVSLHYTILDGRVEASTPSFLGADPAASPLLGPHLHRPLAAAEDLGRELVHALSADQMRQARLARNAPVDIVTANRTEPAEGDNTVDLPFVFRGRLPDPFDQLMADAQVAADAKAGLTPDDRTRLAFSRTLSGVRVRSFTLDQTEILRALLASYLDRLPDELATAEHDKLAGTGLDPLSFAWAGGIDVGEPHYYRIQGPSLLVEYDNTQRDVNHIHTVWRDLDRDFGGDALAEHYRQAH